MYNDPLTFLPLPPGNMFIIVSRLVFLMKNGVHPLYFIQGQVHSTPIKLLIHKNENWTQVIIFLCDSYIIVLYEWKVFSVNHWKTQLNFLLKCKKVHLRCRDGLAVWLKYNQNIDASLSHPKVLQLLNFRSVSKCSMSQRRFLNHSVVKWDEKLATLISKPPKRDTIDKVK